VVITAWLLSLPGCAMLLRTTVSQPQVAGVGMTRGGFLPATLARAPMIPLGGRHGGVRMQTEHARLTLYVANERDRIVAVGPWILVPLPILPIWWAREDHKIEQACNPSGANEDSAVVVVIELRGRGTWADSLIRFRPQGIRVRRADGRELPLRSAMVSAWGLAEEANITRSPAEGRRWVRLRVNLEGDIPVEEDFTVELPEATLGSDVIRFPPVRYSRGRGWVAAMPRIV
jgi:hypothetical protein